MNHSARRINALAHRLNARRYLEIGVGDATTFNEVDIAERTGVEPNFPFDIGPASNATTQFFPLPSDAYFAGERSFGAFDIVFIDGHHTFEQVVRDFANTLLRTHRRSAILLDDTVPSDVFSTVRDPMEGIRHRTNGTMEDMSWHGDTYKAVFYIHDFWPGLNYRTILSDNPQTLVWRSGGLERAPLFDDLEKISRLDYFEMHRHFDVMQGVSEEEAIALCVAELLAPLS